MSLLQNNEVSAFVPQICCTSYWVSYPSFVTQWQQDILQEKTHSAGSLVVKNWYMRTIIFVQNNAFPWRLKMSSIIVKGQSPNMEDKLNADSSVFCSVNQGTVKERSFVGEANQPISNPKSVAINISDITVWVQIWLLSWYFGGELTHTGGFICPSCQVEDLQEDLLCWTAHMSKCILIKHKHWTGAGQVKLPKGDVVWVPCEYLIMRLPP